MHDNSFENRCEQAAQPIDLNEEAARFMQLTNLLTYYLDGGAALGEPWYRTKTTLVERTSRMGGIYPDAGLRKPSAYIPEDRVVELMKLWTGLRLSLIHI